MSDEVKIKAFLCSCYGAIDKIIPLTSLTDNLRGNLPEVVCHNHLCSEEGITLINFHIQPNERVLIAACSPFHKQREFEGLRCSKSLTERVNLREQCAFAHRDEPAKAMVKAETLIKMAIEKLRHSSEIQKNDAHLSTAILVIGGGIAGINAALSSSASAEQVLLLEKSAFLGGRVKELSSYFPRMCPPSCGLELMFNRIIDNHNISLSTLSEVISVKGSPGNLEITYRKNPRYIDEQRCTLCAECIRICPAKAIKIPSEAAMPPVPAIMRNLCPDGCSLCAESCPSGAINLGESESTHTYKAGAIIAATGWDPFDPSQLSEYSYGKIKNIATNLGFESIIKEIDSSKRTFAFIQCVGSRDERHLPYCSDVCCMVSIKQALALKQLNPDNEVTIFYNDIRTPGEYELFYRRARKEGVRFVKGIPSEVKEIDSGNIGLTVFDTVLNKRINIEADFVVLATGMQISEGTKSLCDTLGTGINLNENGFVASHIQCYPQDSLREGIYSAGTCRGPMDVSSSIESASSAAISALSYINQKKKELADFPRINTEKCDLCKRCIEECPHRAYSFDAKGFPVSDSRKCRRCGICLGSCPVGAISIGEISIEQLSAMIDVIDPTLFGDEEPLILAFLCKNDAYRAVDDLAKSDISYDANILTIPLPCAGAINGLIAAKAISSGIDGIIVGGCDEQQCHFAKGSSLAKERLKAIRDKLTEMFLEPERVRFCTIPRDGGKEFTVEIANLVKELRQMGKNPLRIL